MKKSAKKPPSRGGARPGAGRKPSDNPKTVQLSGIRVTVAERDHMQSQADAANLTLSAWVRMRLGI